MNLVKAEEYAKGLPFPELKKYADGFNPDMIPPWLATGVMDAKTKLAETANNLQGAANGPQASTKEQIEQKAGLMALQAAQKQQQLAAMQNQPAAGPVPENAPEANPQPEPEGETFTAARGGLTRLPSNLKFGGGGIVAFSGEDESLVERYGAIPKLAAELGVPVWAYKQAAEFLARTGTNATVGEVARALVKEGAKATGKGIANLAKTAATGPGMAVMAGGVPATQFATDVMANNPKLRGAYADMGAMGGAMDPDGALAAAILDQGAKNEAKSAPAPAVAESADAETEKLKRLAAARANTGISQNTQLAPNAAKPQGASTGTAATPSAGQSGLADSAAPAANSLAALYRQALEGGPKERKIADILAEQNEIRKGAGLGDEAGLAKLQRIKDIKDQFRATAPDALDDAIRVFSQAGQFKGLSGTGGAYTANQAQKRAQELAMSEKINELMGGVEDTQRAEKTALAGKVSEGRAKDLEQAAQFGREKMQSLGSTSASQYTADMHYRAAMAQLKSTAAREGLQQQRLLLDTFKTELATIDKELAPLLKAPFGPAKAQIAELQARKAGLTKALDEASGISKIMPAPGAASPGGTTRMRFDAQGNQIK